jgi:uncharacterized membrane protein YebE (DUF533 family)
MLGRRIGRRRPLLRGAMLAGGGAMAYQAGKRRQADLQHEADQDAALGDYPPPQAYPAPAYPPAEPAPAPAPAPTPAPASEADRIQALAQLKDLLDQGAISQDEFDTEKRKLLGG